MIIAIDGPAGAGKSTVAAKVAKQLNFQLIDTGALYRSVTYRAIANDVSFDNIHDLVALATDAHFRFQWDGDNNTLYCNGNIVGDEIRTEEISVNTSKLATIPEIRRSIVDISRKLGQQESSVLEGRDIGTAVFPDAEVKIFLIASPDIRAERRVKQAAERGELLNFEEVKQSIIERDTRDSTRETTPLRCADDAIRIDSSTMTIDEVVDKILSIAKA